MQWRCIFTGEVKSCLYENTLRHTLKNVERTTVCGTSGSVNYIAAAAAATYRPNDEDTIVMMITR